MNTTISISIIILYYHTGTYVYDNRYLTRSSRDVLYTYKTAMVLRLCLRDML